MIADHPKRASASLVHGVRTHIEAARQAASVAALNPKRYLHLPRYGSLRERAMSNLDAAEAHLLNIAPAEYLLGRGEQSTRRQHPDLTRVRELIRECQFSPASAGPCTDTNVERRHIYPGATWNFVHAALGLVRNARDIVPICVSNPLGFRWSYEEDRRVGADGYTIVSPYGSEEGIVRKTVEPPPAGLKAPWFGQTTHDKGALRI